MREVTATKTARKAKLIFTFDDGDISHLTVAAPILRQKGFAGTAYVGANIPVQYWTEKGKMKESELEELYSLYGWDISNHTLTHLMIGFCTDEDSLRILRQEYLDNQNWILSHGWARGAYHAAYPYGFFSDPLCDILREIGVKTARTCVSGLETTPLCSPYKLSCIDILDGSAFVKNQIDFAVSNGSTVILMFHAVNDSGNDYTITTSAFQDIAYYVFQYVQQSKLDVTTMSEWYHSDGGTILRKSSHLDQPTLNLTRDSSEARTWSCRPEGTTDDKAGQNGES